MGSELGGSDKSLDFMISIRDMLREFDKMIVLDDAVTEEATIGTRKLMRLLTLFCEGHNHNVQSYFGRINVVTEVANFGFELSRILAREFQANLVKDEILPMKSHPKVMGHKRSVINWTGKSIENKQTKFVNIEKLSLLAEAIEAVFEALSEFCQGPCYENQLLITRAGSTREFSTFFEFFGAYQLVLKDKNLVSLQNFVSEKYWVNEFNNRVKYAFTHEALQNLYDTNYGCWYGNDPLALMILISRQMKEENYIAKSKRFKFLPFISDDPDKNMSQSGKNFRGIVDIAAVEPEEPVIQTNSLEYFLKQKTMYMTLQQLPEENEQRVDNIFQKINDFGEKLSSLEASCLKLAASLLEGVKTDEDMLEIPRTVFQSIGETNIICNMANYWDRYLSYSSLNRDVQPQNCFERQMAYDYYCLSMRICDIPFASDFRDIVFNFIVNKKISIDQVSVRIITELNCFN